MDTDSTSGQPRLGRRSWIVAASLAACLVAGIGGLAAEPERGRLLTVAIAERLVADDHQLVVGLADVRELSPDVAQVLARCRSVLVLSGLSDLSPDVAAALAACHGVIDLSGLTSLSPEAAKHLATYRGPQLELSGIINVTPAVTELAKAARVRLSPSTAPRKLRHLTTADAENLAARIDPWNGDLSGLVELSPDVAAVLARSKVRVLRLNGLTTLSPEAALVLAQNTAWDGSLPGIVGFEAPDSVAVAAALATRTGPLRLPGLKRISPKTLSALIAKEDIEIPLIETLELIQEPDGSPTEDFVIPKELEPRQKRQRMQ